MFVTFTSTVVILLMYALFLKLTVVSFANFRWISNLLPSKSGYMVVRMNFIGCRHRRVLRGTGFCLLFARHFPLEYSRCSGATQLIRKISPW